MSTMSRITTTATMTTSGPLTVGDLKGLLLEAPDSATVRITEDRDRGVSSTTVSVTWEPQPKTSLHNHGSGVCRPRGIQVEEMGG